MASLTSAAVAAAARPKSPTPGPDLADQSPFALELTGVSKWFGPVHALKDVTVQVRPGEVHALVGENGAGKSTLMAIASGALSGDAGDVTVAGARLTSASPELARSLGLAIVRQDPALLPDLTVAENFAVGVGHRAVGGLRQAPDWAQRQLDPWHMDIDARARVASLSVEQRFIVEIAKALALAPKVLILDEPTEHLNLEEVQRLFRRVRELVAGGAAVVYISHRIPEVKEIADRITVLRDGAVRGTFQAADVDEQRIVELVVGRALEAVFPVKGSVAGTIGADVRLAARHLTGRGINDVDLEVRAGEIVGLAGVQGNGQTELIRSLAGVTEASGQLVIDSQPVKLGSSAAVAAAGGAYVPADRHAEGAFLTLSVADNTVLRTLRRVARAGMVQASKVQAVAQEQVARLSIKTPSVRTPISALSGGNQQKVVLARTLLAEPTVVLAEEPTQGVDAGARVDIYRILRDAADGGAAIVVLSSDGVELTGLCDRVLIMSRGRIVDELAGDAISEEAIVRGALTATTTHDSQAHGRAPWWRRALDGDHAPAGVLGFILVALTVIVGILKPDFVSQLNLNNVLFAAAPLILVGVAQQVVVLGAGIDLSIGPAMGLMVVIASFWLVGGGNLVVGYLLMLAAAVLVGVVNAVTTIRAQVNPVVATLAMYMLLQGLYQVLRPVPSGLIAETIQQQVQARIGPVPVVTIVAVVVCLVGEFALRRSRFGVQLRAVGSRADAARRLGIKVSWVLAGSYLVASVLTMPAALFVAAQIGIGDGSSSVAYTMSSITVVVLAGTSVFGGRGSFIGVLVAALLLQVMSSALPFLGLSQYWSYWLPGLIIVAAAATYAQFRRVRS